MKLPKRYTARPARREDVDRLVGLMGACERHDFGSADPARAEILFMWGRVGFDLTRDARFVLAADGAVAGYGHVGGYDPSVEISSWIHVHPDHRGSGIGSGLLGWAEAHAAQKLAVGTVAPFRATCPAIDLAARALLDRRGFIHVRSFWQMEKTLSPDEARGSDPPGIAIRVSIADADDRSIYRIFDEAFRDHFGMVHYPFEDWQQEFRSGDEYDPTLVFIAEEGAEPVGANFTFVDEGIGWVAELGVRQAWRGRGIGRALLLRSFAELSRRGVKIVRLGVDAANSTGATHLYERAGMSVRREWHVHEKAISRD